MSGERLLDLRGMRCPWPALRVARAMREGEGAILAVADDPAAPREIAALAAERGWTASTAESPLGPALRIAHP
ncbi:MAG TPA: sulfurtransferase TusA family protein [Sphingomonas sp.]|nr:sulfurtransferase TusA family protein [Sphingomonas sp.]